MLIRQEGQGAYYTMSLDLSRTEERARMLAVINNVLQNLKLFVIISSSDYEEDSEVLDFIQNDLVCMERWRVIEHPIFFD